MGIKNIHIILIVASIALSIFCGIWALNHGYIVSAWASIIMAGSLLVYCIKFIKKMKTVV